MTEFWDNFLKVGIHPNSPTDGLQEALTYLQNNSPDSIPSKETAISILFHRIGKAITECYFGDINVLTISLLCELAPISSINHFMQPGLFDSIMVLFLNDEATFEKSVEFLDKFFDRPDINTVFEDILMVTIINLANYSPPRRSLWRFMCKFFTKFGETIENLCDFKALESNGMLPIFTRSLIWDYRNIYQNPPDGSHEEVFWTLWKSVLERYKEELFDKPLKQEEEEVNERKGKPVLELFQGLLNEIRLSIYFSLSSARIDNQYVSETPLKVWKLLHEINSEELVMFMESQLENDALKVALQASLLFIEKEKKGRIQKMFDAYK